MSLFSLLHPMSWVFIIVGFLTALGLSYWDKAKGSCLLVPIYLYFFGAWCINFALILFVDHTTRAGFFIGFCLYYIKSIFAFFASVFARIQWHREDRAYETRRKLEAEIELENQRQRSEQVRQERERREEETRQYREQQERARRDQEQTKSQHHEKTKEPPRRSEPEMDTRTPEAILGLSSGWTPDDLKTAYKREAQRLHPDKWTGKMKSTQDEMEKEFKKVQWAYKKLGGK